MSRDITDLNAGRLKDERVVGDLRANLIVFVAHVLTPSFFANHAEN